MCLCLRGCWYLRDCFLWVFGLRWGVCLCVEVVFDECGGVICGCCWFAFDRLTGWCGLCVGLFFPIFDRLWLIELSRMTAQNDYVILEKPRKILIFSNKITFIVYFLTAQ